MVIYWSIREAALAEHPSLRALLLMKRLVLVPTLFLRLLLLSGPLALILPVLLIVRVHTWNTPFYS